MLTYKEVNPIALFFNNNDRVILNRQLIIIRGL